MKEEHLRTLVLLVCGLVTMPAFADVVPPPVKFEHRKGEETPVDKPVFKANAQLGFLLANGNAEAYGLSGSGTFGTRFYNNAFELFGQGAYSVIGTSDHKGGPITGTQNSVRNWLVRPRYDRFFAGNNSVFALMSASGDEPGGFVYRLEPMAGYKRFLLVTPKQLLSGEIGYAYTYEKYVSGAPVSHADFHQARTYFFYENKFTPLASFSEGVEVLWALNQIERVRINSTTSLSSSISKAVSLKLNLTVKANLDPTERPTYTDMDAMGNTVTHAQGKYDKVDTILEAVLAVTFL